MRKFIFTAFFVTSLGEVAFAQVHWTFELHGGSAYNLPMPLTVSQKGYSDIKLTARYRSEAFIPPVYWDWRFSRWENGKSWEFEAIHHKLYLDNTTVEIQKFNISHGFNIITVNRGFDKKTYQYRVGTGIVLSHPESRIRGQEFGDSGNSMDMGYYISGPIVNLAISKPFRLGGRFFVNVEAKTTLAYSYIKVSQGHADVFNVAFHIILGFGVDFIKPKKE